MILMDSIFLWAKFILLLLMFLSAGGALFYNIYSQELDNSYSSIKILLFKLILITIFYSFVFQFLDVVRFSGNIGRVFDYELHKIILLSHLGIAKMMSILGLSIMVISFWFKANEKIIISTIGISFVVISFTFTGHTSENPYQILLAPLLILHIYIIIFWFGGLTPLYYVLKVEHHTIAGKIVKDFSKKATILVPIIFVAGVILSIVLMQGINFLDHTYGLILLFKLVVFSILMLVAGLNKFRLGPALERGELNAAKNLQKAILFEIILIFLIIGATTILTGLYSPTTL